MAERLASSVVFGAYLDGHIIGMIGLKQEDGPKKAHKGFVWGFYVEPEGRQQGVATRLMTTLIEAARSIVEQLTLTVVQENEVAIALYKRFGFTIYGVEPRAHKTSTGYLDQVLMVLLLQQA
jgi:ribosomal protein S18 acetylase RimI-like enzyme